MSSFSLILFDDAAARGWEPFALTRPIGELLFGAFTMRARAERILGTHCTMHLAAPHLHGFQEEGAPPVRGFVDAPVAGARLFLSSRALLQWGAAASLPAEIERGHAVTVDGEVVGWYAPAGTCIPDAGFWDHPAATATELPIPLPGRVLRHVWDLVSGNPDQITEDIGAVHPDAGGGDVPPGSYLIGDGALICSTDVRIEPGVVFDTSGGPIWLDKGVRVRALTRLAGPAYIGRGSAILGGTLEAVSLGPVCKVRGELAESVCLGYVNKAHDGHIGHAYLGRWVNLGAETTNSDLKNNYGTIRLWTPTGEVDTGEIKLGCLLGDHVKTGIGLLLNTGTVVGAGSNLYGAAMPPKYVPPFSWGTGDELVEYRADKFLDVAERAMARREVGLSAPGRMQLQAAWDRGRAGTRPATGG
jgi:UDP-N-acetylglucosamine diphosphorylase/glucosamine-1-phosphate N-acetyltransferase